MRYGSICSGIEAASTAFAPLGWKAAWFSEIDKFPCAVLDHHYPDVPNHGDMTTIRDRILSGEIEAPDMICGGPPCQSFSVAGLRNSLSDDRGNLTLEYIKICDATDHIRSTTGREPAWILYENVPGIFSTNDNAFGAFLGGLVGRTAPIPEPADGWTGAGVVDGPTRCAAWRVLNAEHFGLAQRRKRVFVLAKGGAGRWAVADALLPIIESSRWHPAPSRGTGKGVAQDACSGTGSDRIEGVDYENNGVEAGEPMGPLMKGSPSGGGRPLPVVAFAQNTRDEVRYQGDGEGFDASEDGTGRGIPLVMATGQASAMSAPTIDMAPTLSCNHEAPILMRMREGKEGGGKGPLVSEDKSLTLATANDQVLAVDGYNYDTHANTAATVSTMACHNRNMLLRTMQVRRLTPVECCRLQGFPDVREILTLHVCSDHQKTSVSAEEKSLKSLPFAGPASQRRLSANAAFAERHSPASHLKTSRPAEVLVEINFEAGTIKATIQGEELFASASIADREGRTFLQTPLGSFAQLVAHTISERRKTQTKSDRSGTGSLMDESGGLVVSVSGSEITECVKNAEELERIKSTCSTYTTLPHGSDTRSEDLPTRTLCSYVVAAIAGFIPSEMWNENFCIRIEASWDYLDIIYRGKPAADGPKYKALGNSWAVPVVRWIGERIKAIRPVG